MNNQEPRVSVTFYTYFASSKEFYARALGMELAEQGLITQVNQVKKEADWCLYIYFRCVPHSAEFDSMARHLERRAKAWGGRFDGWEYPVDGVEFNLPGEWEDVEMFPVETVVAKSGTKYLIKIDPL